MAVHGDNLKGKLSHSTKYLDDLSKSYLEEIAEMYKWWSEENKKLRGPFKEPSEDDAEIVKKRVVLFNQYKNFIDQQKYAEKFDSRSNLHSSVLEEFLEYLFGDLVFDIDPSALLGKSHAFKDIFFRGASFEGYLKRPEIVLEKKDHDFVIGITVEANFRTRAIDSEVMTDTFDLPVVAIECKTYLDKTMLEGSSTAASQLKSKNPDALYFVCSEWLKLTNSINLKKYQVDQIYVLRKQKNTDREDRYADTYVKNPIFDDVTFAMFTTVREHLTNDWETTISSRLQDGLLL